MILNMFLEAKKQLRILTLFLFICYICKRTSIGDATYGKGPLNRAVAQWFGADRLMLHCARMTLPHPVTGEEIDIRAPLVEGPFRSAVERLGWLEAYEELMNGPWREPPAQAQLLA